MTKNNPFLEQFGRRLAAEAERCGQEYQRVRECRREIAKFKRKIGRYKFDRHRKLASALLEAGIADGLSDAFLQAEAVMRARKAAKK